MKIIKFIFYIGHEGFHNLYEWYQSKENDHFPDPYGLRARIEHWTFGFYPACIKYLMAAFDVPEVGSKTFEISPPCHSNLRMMVVCLTL